MISKLTLAGFRACVDTTALALGPLTVLAGANNTGKSSFIGALLSLVQSQQAASRHRLLLSNDWVDLGPFDELLSPDRQTFTIGMEGLWALTALANPRCGPRERTRRSRDRRDPRSASSSPRPTPRRNVLRPARAKRTSGHRRDAQRTRRRGFVPCRETDRARARTDCTQLFLPAQRANRRRANQHQPIGPSTRRPRGVLRPIGLRIARAARSSMIALNHSFVANIMTAPLTRAHAALFVRRTCPTPYGRAAACA
jgi:hypothetical protein